MSSDAEREALLRDARASAYAHEVDDEMGPGSPLDIFMTGYIAGVGRRDAEWARSRPVSDAEVEAAALELWRADHAEMETSWLSNRDHYINTARAALEAARKVSGD